MPVKAQKDGRVKTFTDIQWSLMPDHKYGWKAMGETTVVKKQAPAPPEAIKPNLEEKVSVDENHEESVKTAPSVLPEKSALGRKGTKTKDNKR